MKTVGILGGGQLGSMLSESLYKLGAKVIFYDPEPTSPSFIRSSQSFNSNWNDFNKLKEFFSACDIVTYEFENVSTEILDSLVKNTGTPLYPSVDVLSITQNRIFEKTFLKENGFPVCNFIPVKNFNEIKLATKKLEFPYIIKTATGGYDGKGQWNITNQNDFENFSKEFTQEKFVELIFEEKINIEFEASCIIARDASGTCISFPVFDNIHKEHVLYNTTVPSQIPNSVQQKMTEISMAAAQKFNVVGLLTTEFFISNKKNINNTQTQESNYVVYVNEFAPRPHNSGHITRNACQISQFDAHARVLLNLPLHEPKLHAGYFCMGNLLGKTWIQQNRKEELNLSAWKNTPEVIDIVLYGKTEAKPKRKMGHFVTFSETNGQHIAAAEKFREELNETK